MSSRDGDTTRVSVRRVCAPIDPHAEACLVTIYGPDLGRKISLERAVMTIGRDPRSDVVVPLDEISRQHCRIEKSADAVLVRDLESTNGTHLNDRALLASVDYELASGDLIHLGGVVFKFLDGGNVESLYHEEIYRMAIVDGLTRVYNRRYLLDFLGRDMSRCRRHRRPLTILLFGVDHFKRINDEHGHMAGDHVLREICALVSSGVRREECLARCGGDEFVIVMPETRLDAARMVGERLRGLVEARDFRLGSTPLHVTVSVGLAELMPHMSEPSQFLQAADANLYAAKNAGRNALAG